MNPIHIFSSLPSTNNTAWELARQGEPHGAVVLAYEQHCGRGRLGKTWHTVSGKGLYCTIIIRPEIASEEYPKLTLVSGVAVALAIEQIAAVECQLKWPNDIYIKGHKCAGILAEASVSTSVSEDRFAVIGIGINLTSELADFPTELHDRVTSILLESGRHFTPLEMVESVRGSLLRWVSVMEKEGFEPILSLWKERDFLIGKRLEWLANDGQVVVGESLGPDTEGQLRVRDGKGRVHLVLSGDVSLAVPK